jgi:AraC family transcriptional regulator of adaptative response/methylated-DNA-[protein]-cysteine methyltransferase
VRKALNYIQRHFEDRITLRALAEASGLSPNHLQSLFVRIVGLSPKALFDYLRLVRLKRLLRSEESVAAASYAAGYGSIRALYEKANRMLGMTPATYRDGGPGIDVRYATSDVSFGHVLLATSNVGICTVLLGLEDDQLIQRLCDEFPHAVLTPERKLPGAWRTAIDDCQREDPLLSRTQIPIRRDVFLARVWHALL